MVNSGWFDGLPSQEGIEKVSDYLEEKGWGQRTVSYRLRDWLISRQRYWGAPIPMIYCEKCGVVPVPEKDLPVLLPEDAEFKPTGESPLKYNEGFVSTNCPQCSSPARRETDTMDTFVCSSWYFLRYCSPHDDRAAFEDAAVKHWCPVDFYTGGAEHAVMHLLYVRFFTKAIRDIDLIDFGEPFKKLFNQGILIKEHMKISKSRGNVVNPDEYVASLGADTVRAYLMFLGPWDQGGDWDDSGINGVSRWLNRVWNLVTDDYKPGAASGQGDAATALLRLAHQTIKKVTQDIERIRFNTMIAALMEYTNYLIKVKEAGSVTQEVWDESVEALILLLAPSTPHLAEELWEKTGREYSVHNQAWPEWNEELAREEEITLVVQVNGKIRDKLAVPASISGDEAKEMAAQQPKARAYLESKDVVKVIYVPGKLVNFVVR
jgi:leucyl-tRNA synthetase